MLELKSLKDIKLYILDMDGTIYLGSKLFSYTKDFFEFLENHDKEYILFTNNASKNVAAYADKLKSMSLAVPEKNILTSGDVTAAFLKKHRSKSSVYLVGTELLRDLFVKEGIALTEQDPDIVVTSFDTSLTYEKLDKACRYIREGAEFISTHCDINCPTENGFMPDSGAICAAITASTGVTPRFFGKPYKETIEMIEEITGYGRKDMAIIGDRLYTDIKMGKNSGIKSILVLSGETKASDLEKSDIVPDWVFEDLGQFLDNIRKAYL